MKIANGNIAAVFTAFMALAGGAALSRDAMAQDMDLKVSRSEAMKAATSRVQPDYPVIAKQLHLEGTVEVEAHIGEDGSVESVKPVTGNAVLANAAVMATKRWKFTPFTAGGKNVKAIASLSFIFKL
ncbi:MAG: energy transducer TonB [Acidobacteriota bacterium]|nr:energy transducer TonB [Acidobacteriota bacterium]